MTDPGTLLRNLGDEALVSLQGRGAPVSLLGVSSQVQAVANAFVTLGLLPEPDAEAVLAELEARIDGLGLRVAGRPSGELTLRPGAHNFWPARSRRLHELAGVPLSVALPQLEITLGSITLSIDSLIVTPSGLRGDARKEQTFPSESPSELATGFSDLTVTDNVGRPYQLRSDGGATLTESLARRAGRAPGWQRWSGQLVSEPGVPSDTAWLEVTVPGEDHTTRINFSPLRSGPTGTADPPWPTPAETYLAWLAPEAFATGADVSIGVGLSSREATEVVAVVADALLAVGALPPHTSLLRRLPDDMKPPWQRDTALRWSRRAQRTARALGGRNPDTSVGAAFPLDNAVAVLEYISVIDDAVTLWLYVSPYVEGEYWPVKMPCVKVDASDENGTLYQSTSVTWRGCESGEGRAAVLMWPPVAPEVSRLRIKVSTLWEAGWIDIDLPGR